MNKAEFGKRLRMDMSKQGMTFRRLAELTGLTIHVLSYMTAGKGSFYRDRLEKVSEVFHYSPEIWPPLDGDTAPVPKVKADYSEDYEKRPKPHCRSCKYLWLEGDQLYCLFCHDTGEPRGCKPIECKEKGRWEPGQRKGGEIPWEPRLTPRRSKKRTKR